MSISFLNIPADLRVPGQYVEFDASRATTGLPASASRILILGQKLAAGAAAVRQPVTITSANQARQLFGRGSMLAAMCTLALAANDVGQIVAVPEIDLVGGAAATATITVTGPATAAGTIELRVDGRRYPVGVASAASAATVATAIAAAINADPDRSVDGTANAAVVTLTARHKGVCGNDLDARHSHYTGEALPTGIGLTITAFTGGTGNPDIVPLLAAVADMGFQLIVTPWTDVTNLGALTTEIADRQGPIRMLEGIGFAGARGTQGGLASIGSALNSPYLAVIGANGAPEAPWLWAATAAAVIGYAAAIDPARPFQTLVLPKLIAPKQTARFTKLERELLLKDGISTFIVDAGGAVALERVITTYQLDSYGLDDTAWLDINTPLTLAYLRISLRTRIAQKYPRHKLAGDGTAFSAGQSVVTPNILSAELLALAREWETAGLVENVDQFKRDLIVERDPNDANRVNALVPPDLVNQLRIFAAAIQFRL